jgi:K+-sensing histidine kinase KdpD
MERDYYTTIRSAAMNPDIRLGLSIVRAVAEQHEGTVSVESTVGQGTRFTIELPVKVSHPKPALTVADPKSLQNGME